MSMSNGPEENNYMVEFAVLKSQSTIKIHKQFIYFWRNANVHYIVNVMTDLRWEVSKETYEEVEKKFGERW